MDQHRKYSFDDKLTAMKLYVRINNAAEVARILGFNKTLVRIWYRQYTLGGVKALLPLTTGIKHDLYTRISIVEDLLKNELSLIDASAVFGISYSTLNKWVKSVKKEGFTSLFDSKPSNKQPGTEKRKKDVEALSELEQLREENMRLRAELDLIKKVDALVSERCKRIVKSEQEPSKN